jgi:hypothetical protein
MFCEYILINLDALAISIGPTADEAPCLFNLWRYTMTNINIDSKSHRFVDTLQQVDS